MLGVAEMGKETYMSYIPQQKFYDFGS